VAGDTPHVAATLGGMMSTPCESPVTAFLTVSCHRHRMWPQVWQPSPACHTPV